MLTLILVSAIATSLVLGFVAFQRRKNRDAASLVVLACGLSVWAVSFQLFSTNNKPGELFWLGMIFLGSVTSSFALLAFILEYIGQNKRGVVIALILVGGLTQAVIEMLRWKTIFFSVGEAMALETAMIAGPWSRAALTFYDCINLFVIVLLAQTFSYKPRQYLIRSAIIIAGVSAPIILHIPLLFSFGFSVVPTMDLTPVGFTITGALIAFSLMLFKSSAVAPLGRDAVIEKMNDGWMIVDAQDRIVDINPAIEALIELPREKVFGQPVEKLLKDWPKMQPDRSTRELEIRGSINLRGQWRYLNMRVSPLGLPTGRQLGKIIIWRDVTERRRAEDARQRAREEMFILLRGISAASSRSLNNEDFLSDAMYQILYSFHSQASAIFIVNEGDPNAGERTVNLAASYGIDSKALGALSSELEVIEIGRQVLESKVSFSVPVVGANEEIPGWLNKPGFRSLAIIPMIIEDEVQGMICVARKEGSPYSVDEIARLEVVAEEVSSLLYSGRQRHIAIALEERQNLVRDLHDSVTQKLYGLVALTEAAQASMDADGGKQTASVIPRIAESARQALKEMRLVLFQMKPIDLEQEGLIAAIHQRLASVEGRADMKARLVCDDKIQLSLDQQVALYYIAQEGLNNILKHAHAKSVVVSITKKRKNIVLEVQDDGIGFDPNSIGKGGMGLPIMKERTAKMNGKFKIDSAPGKGTKITVTVNKDSPLTKINTGLD